MRSMPRFATLIFVLALLIGSGLRLWQLDAMPPGFYHDEAYNALDALSLLEGRTFPQYYEGWEHYRFEAHGERGPFETQTPIFFEGNYGREPLHVYLMAASVALFGRTTTAIRLVPALAGVLSIATTALAAYVLSKQAGISKEQRYLMAAGAAFAVAVLFPAVHFSRFALRAMLFVPVETLCVVMFWRGIDAVRANRPSVRPFIIAGLLLGGGLYVYAAARMFPLLFVGFCAWLLWHDADHRRVLFGRFAIMATVALVVTLPMLAYFAAYPYFLFFRSAYVATHGKGVVEGQPLLTFALNLGRIARGFIWQGETHLRHNLPGRPYLDAIQLVFFAAGVWQLRRWTSPRRLFLLLWFFVMLLPSAMSGDAPHFGRLTGVVPIVGILVGSGFAHFVQQLNNKNMRFALPIGLLLISAVWTTNDYFNRYGQLPQTALDFYLPDWQLGQWAAGQSADADLYMTPGQEELATILYALGDKRDAFRNYDGSAGAILFGRPNTPTIHLIADSDATTLARLRPLAAAEIAPQLGWTALTLAPPAILPANGQIGNVVSVGSHISSTPDQLIVDIQWQPLVTFEEDLVAFVHVIAADGSIVAQNDRPPAGYPTSSWQLGELIQDQFIISLDTAACSQCTVVSGLYRAADFGRPGEPVTLQAP